MARTLNNEVDILNIASLDNDIKDSFTRAMISEDVNTTSAAAKAYAKGEYFIHNDRYLYKALEDIASGTTITPDVNAEVVTVSEELVRLFAQSPEGIFEILSNIQNGDSATRNFVKGEQIIWKDKQLYNVTADVVSGGTWVVGTNIDLADNLTSQIKALNDNDDAMLNTLGAKNLLPNEGTTQTLSGITFTVNPDGSVTVSGTAASSSTPFIVYVNNFTIPKSGKYIVSGNPNAEETFMQIMDKTDSTNHVFSSVGDEEYDFDSTHVYQMRLAVVAGKTVNETFYPMIRPASIADDTYVPYAMTNKQLTDNLDILEGLTYDSTLGTITGYYTKAGHVVTVSFRIALKVAINNTTAQIGKITNELPQSLPTISFKQHTWTARNSSRGGYIHGYFIQAVDTSDASNGRVTAESGTAQIGDVLYITFSYIAS